jgi:hypothetical protein
MRRCTTPTSECSANSILREILTRSLGIDHVTYALFDFSLSFLIYLVITFLVHLYQSTGITASSKQTSEEEGYRKLDRDGPATDAEAYELTDQDLGG